MWKTGAKAMSFGRGGRWLVVLLLVGAAGGAVAWHIRRSQPVPDPEPVASEAAPPLDPRLAYPTRYRNVHPDVAYVGAERCAGCHREITAHYRQHPMGRSLAPLDDPSSWPALAPKPWKPFDALGWHYRMEERDGKLWHFESKRDSAGTDITAQAEQVRYVVGSGTRGRSYLIERDGRLYQSPISWFGEEGRWDLSPGYEHKQSHFDRTVGAACLFCHSNRALAVDGTVNGYRAPIFEGHAIGCERCHGPGELHVRRHERGEEYAGPDDTIVQPGRLEPHLRDSVCQQCHLQGRQRVLRRGRSWFDYRPGLPLDEFVTTFVNKRPDLRSVGQVEQMMESRCHQQSQGKLGCISCHDPHQAPSAAEKVAYYRKRCQSCHDAGAAAECRLPLSDRRAREDSCIACHMPRTGSANVVHVSITDHRIVRHAKDAPGKAKPDADLRPGEAPMVDFHKSRRPDDPEYQRDLGIILASVALSVRSKDLAMQALPRLQNATERDARDFDAWQHYGHALTVLREPEEALRVAEAVLARAPKNEVSLFQAASLAMMPDKLDRAVDYWQRLLALHPSALNAQIGLMNTHALRGDWPQAAAAAEKAVRLSPTETGPRISWIQALLHAGQRERAEQEFTILEKMRPANLDQVRRWFATKGS